MDVCHNFVGRVGSSARNNNIQEGVVGENAGGILCVVLSWVMGCEVLVRSSSALCTANTAALTPIASTRYTFYYSWHFFETRRPNFVLSILLNASDYSLYMTSPKSRDKQRFENKLICHWSSFFILRSGWETFFGDLWFVKYKIVPWKLSYASH